VTPNPRFLYFSRSHREALASLFCGIEGDRGFLALIAEPGLGKTTLTFQLLEKLQQTARTVFLFQTQCSSREFVQHLLSAMGVDTTGIETVSMHNRLNEILAHERIAGRRFILAIDEAQNLRPEVLETIRLLSNFETPRAKLLQILLIGQPQLARTLASTGLAQLQQRISVFARLEPFDYEDTTRYISHRLQMAGYSGPPLFTPDALRTIAEQSRGIPREINRLCFNALSLGCAIGRAWIDSEIMGEVVSDLRVECWASAGTPTFDDVAGTWTMSPAAMNRGKNMEVTFTAPIPKQAIEWAPRAVEPSKPAPSNKLAAVSAPTTEELEASFAPKPHSTNPAREAFSRNGLGSGSLTGATISAGMTRGESRGRKPLIFGGAAILLAGLGGGYYFLHQSNTPDPFQIASETSGATNTPAGAISQLGTTPNSRPVSQGSPVLEVPPVVTAATVTYSSVPAYSQNTGRRTNIAVTNQPEATSASRPAVLTYEMSTLSAPVERPLNIPNASGADALDLSVPVAQGANSAEELPARSESLPGPPPVPVAPTVDATTVAPAKLISSTPLVYPALAMSTNVQGSVLISANIDEYGAVTSARAVSGPVALRQAAVDAVKRWKYTPSMIGGIPSASQVSITLDFRLK